MSQDLTDKLDFIFKPKSIAVIGASNNPGKWGTRMVRNPLRTGYPGAIYPINPREKEIAGIPAYPSVLDVPDKIDLAVIAVPAHIVPQTMVQCIEKGVGGAVVITAGFAETGSQGKSLQDEVVRIASEGGIRFVGPNCNGISSSATKLSLTFNPAPRTGPMAFISQSGTFGGSLAQVASAKGYGLSKFVSIGNQADLNAADYLEYLGDDPDTRVIVMYMEGLVDGHRFFEVAREVVQKKPVVIYKSGRTAAAARATMSHTASLAGQDEIFDVMCRQVGITRTSEAFHPFDMAEALTTQPLPRGNRIGILGSGGQGVVTTDSCALLGMEVPELEEQDQISLREELPAHAPIPRNPVDFAGGNRTGLMEARVADRLAQIEYIDGIIANVPITALRGGLASTDQVKVDVEAAEILSAIPRKYGKPVITLRWVGLGSDLMLEMLKAAGIPSYDCPEDCARAMHALVKYAKVKKAPSREQELLKRPERSKARPARKHQQQIFKKARNQGRTLLTEIESKELLQEAGINTIETRLATSKNEAIVISKEMGFPVVLKIASPDVLHKSDVGGVKMGLGNATQVGKAYSEIMQAVKRSYLEAAIDGVSVQKMARPGIEVIMGMSKDAQLGPVLMFGLGGILVELLKDVSFRIIPIIKEDATEMIGELKGSPLLKGYRGQQPADVAFLEDMLLKVSDFVEQHPEVKELDLNPVFAYKDGAVAVDARVILEDKALK